MTPEDLKRFIKLVSERMLEVASYLRIMRGKVENLGKAAASSVSATEMTTAFTEMDRFVQDYLLVPIFAAFPEVGFVPMAEESTGMKRHHCGNCSDWTLVLDPIDGTAVYCNAGTDYSIMLGLLYRGTMVVAIACHPESQTVWVAHHRGKIRKFQRKEEMILRMTPLRATKNVAVHYRFLRDALVPVAARLEARGYTFATNGPDKEFGTVITGAMRILTGHSCAFIGPHMALHDVAVPAYFIQRAGGVFHLFEYGGKDDADSWNFSGKLNTNFGQFDPTKEPPRYRVIMADGIETLCQLVRDMKP